LVTSKHPEELKNAIEQLLNNSALRKTLAEAATNNAQAYDWKSVGTQFSAQYFPIAK
jgi:glycosyltransferase involved in cell wall biosynthesis